MTLNEALKIALDAYDEDEAERERILELLVPIVLGRRGRLKAAIETAWWSSNDEIIAAIAEYQAERAAIDAEAAGDGGGG